MYLIHLRWCYANSFFPCLCQKTNNFNSARLWLNVNYLVLSHLITVTANTGVIPLWCNESLIHTVPQVTVPPFDRFCAVKDVDPCYLLIRWNDSIASLQRVKSLLWHLACQDNNIASVLLDSLWYVSKVCCHFCCCILKGKAALVSPRCAILIYLSDENVLSKNIGLDILQPLLSSSRTHLYARILLFILWFCSVTEVVKRQHQVWDLERKAEERWKPDIICPSLTRHYFTKQITKKCKLSININTTHSFTSIYWFLNPVGRNFLPFNNWRACGKKRRTKTSTLHCITLRPSVLKGKHSYARYINPLISCYLCQNGFIIA